MLNPDFKDMLSAFVEEEVEFLLVGAHALAAHGIVRATGDLDLWIRPTLENAERVLRALHVFQAPTADLGPQDFMDPAMVLQIGLPPRRIDIVTGIDGVEFQDAWEGRLTETIEGLPIPILGARQMIQNKRATGREKDRLDADDLERLLRRRS